MRWLVSMVSVIIALNWGSCALADKKKVVGWIEPVVVQPQQLSFIAKLDTGAKNSSLNSPKIEILEKNGREIVRFDIKSRDGRNHTLELPLVKRAVIKRHFCPAQERPVVMMEICLGNVAKKVPVNLVDRSKFNYQLLLGRSFLNPEFVIDSATTKTTKPKCRI